MTLSLRSRWNEKRHNRRVVNELTVGIAVLSGRIGFPPRRPQFQGIARGASMSGLQIQAEQVIPVGAVVKLWINMGAYAERMTLKLRGDVVWSEADAASGLFWAGIRLHDRPKESITIWTKYIAERIRSLEL